MQINPKAVTWKIFLVFYLLTCLIKTWNAFLFWHPHPQEDRGLHQINSYYTHGNTSGTTSGAVGFLLSHKATLVMGSPQDRARCVLFLNRSLHSEKGGRNDSCCLIMKTATPLTSRQSKSTTGCFSSGPSHVWDALPTVMKKMSDSLFWHPTARSYSCQPCWLHRCSSKLQHD